MKPENTEKKRRLINMNNNKISLPLPEISQQELADHIEDPDFFLKYGNPVLIRCDSGVTVMAIAYPLAVRLTGAEES